MLSEPNYVPGRLLKECTRVGVGVLKLLTFATIRTSLCSQFVDSEKPNYSETSICLNPIKYLQHLEKLEVANSAVNECVCV